MPVRYTSFIALLAALPACSLEVDAPNSPIPGSTTANIGVGDFAFLPESVAIQRGSTVVWTNQGPSTHTSTSDSGYWDSGVIGVAGPGAVGRYARQFQSVGTFTYHCTFHEVEMKATIVVTP
ncbi:MAG: cupredoxin domain-containing protein [Gemmatimonadales bacterium]